ncbi:hypothetical protein IQ243_01295 [Nostocales cyanobacterium LEGE 11386]|nr:hypothetical protein [Nostocales cyanobacterium LEGE 11386]
MSDNLYRVTPSETLTDFERDIQDLIQKIKQEVRIIYQRYANNSYIGKIFQDEYILLLETYADELVIKYSHNLTQKEPKSIGEAKDYLKKTK